MDVEQMDMPGSLGCEGFGHRKAHAAGSSGDEGDFWRHYRVAK